MPQPTDPRPEPLVDRLADILECGPAELAATTVFRDHPHWDSLAALSTIAMLDSEYGVVVPYADFERLQTIGDLDAYLQTRTRTSRQDPSQQDRPRG
jgi:acyl carrier protein